MSRYSDIQLALVEGQNEAYASLLASLKDNLPSGQLRIREEFIEQYNNFIPEELVPVTSRFPGLLIELDVKGEYEEDSCHVRIRGDRVEVIEKTYPAFSELLSSRECAARDRTYFRNIDLEQIDRRALSFLRFHLARKPYTVNHDLPGNDIIVTFKTNMFSEEGAFCIDVDTIDLDPEKNLVFRGTDPATGFDVSATERNLLPGQALCILKSIQNDINP